jgi:lipopolysaccharide transport system permease protein
MDAPLRTVIEPPKKWLSLDLQELWRYRDLLLLLIMRDISARYRQSVVGYGWAILKPLISMLIFAFVFGRVAGISSDGSPYPLFVLSALLPWMFFSSSLSAVTNSVVGGQSLVSKVYFPRLVLPLSAVCGGAIEFLIQLLLLFCVMIWYQYVPPIQIILLPALLVVACGAALGVGLWLTALNVKFRDVGLAAPFFIQAWMWLSPVVYPTSSVPEHLRNLYSVNPMVGVIDGFRWSILGTTQPSWGSMGISACVVVMVFVSGLYFFRRSEKDFADIL